MIDGRAPGAEPTRRTIRVGPPGSFHWRSFLLPAVLFVLVFAMAATLAVHVKALSPYDEAAHFDYVVQIHKGNFPVRAGERYSEEAIQAWACRPVDKFWSIAPLCGEANSPSDLRIPLEGVNYEAPFGPVYYSFAAAGSAILGSVGAGDFTATRIMSSSLYALGAAFLLLVAQRMAFSSLAAGGLILATSSTPLSVSMGATITPDSMAFLGAAGVIAAAILPRTWRSAVLTTTLVGAVAGLTKPNFVVIGLLGSSLLLVRWISLEGRTSSWQTSRRLLTIGPAVASPLVLSAAGAGLWGALAEARNITGAPADGGFHVSLQSGLGPIDRTAQQLATLLRPDWGTAFSVLETSPVLTAASQVLVLAILGACLCAWLWRIDADPRSVMVLRSVALAIPTSAVVLVAIYWISYLGGHSVSVRYGLPFLAAASVGLGSSLPRRAAIPMGLLGLAMWLCVLANLGLKW